MSEETQARVETRLMTDAEAEGYANVGHEVMRQCGEGSIIVAGVLLGRFLAALDRAGSEILITERHDAHLRVAIAEAQRCYERLGSLLFGALGAMTLERRKRLNDLLRQEEPAQ